MTVPIVTMASAQERINHHSKQLEMAFRDYYAGLNVTVLGNSHTPEQARQSPAYLVFGALRSEGAPTHKMSQAPSRQIVGSRTFGRHDVRRVDRHTSFRINQRKLHRPSGL